MKELYDILIHKVYWYLLGVQLDISIGTLNDMEKNCPTVERCLLAMLDKWLSIYPKKGWSDIVVALRDMGENATAAEVNAKYCSAESASLQGTYTV